GPVDVAVRRSRGDAGPAVPRIERLSRIHGLQPGRARADRAAARAAHDPPQRLDRRPLGRPGLPRRVPVVRHAGLLGPADDAAARAAGAHDAGAAAGVLIDQWASGNVDVGTDSRCGPVGLLANHTPSSTTLP